MMKMHKKPPQPSSSLLCILCMCVLCICVLCMCVLCMCVLFFFRWLLTSLFVSFLPLSSGIGTLSVCRDVLPSIGGRIVFSESYCSHNIFASNKKSEARKADMVHIKKKLSLYSGFQHYHPPFLLSPFPGKKALLYHIHR